MSYGIKKININENSEGFALSTKVAGNGSVFIASGSDYILQDDLLNGVGIFLIDIQDTEASGTLTVNLPIDILSNTDDNFELDANNDITPKV